MDCQEQLMAAEQELAKAQEQLAKTQRVLHTVLGVLTPAQFGSVRGDLEIQDLLAGLDDSAV